MDKNNCDNNSYFYERNYYKDVPIKDTQILEYWNNILGKDVQVNYICLFDYLFISS